MRINEMTASFIYAIIALSLYLAIMVKGQDMSIPGDITG